MKKLNKEFEIRLEELANLQHKRQRLRLNPICFKCGRIMKTREKSKTKVHYGTYYCICEPNKILSIG